MARSLLLATALGTLLTFLFWTKLWQGGGFIGGDTYTYFLPQKAFFADYLHDGEFPLWNNLTGHGYPILGESQTGALYPLNPFLYRLFDLNTAYVASHLFHYVLAFAGCWLLAERLGLNRWGALLASLVYVYGWFPPRACLEWAIIGGAYLPFCLWAAEGWLARGRRSSAVALALLMALDLLAGHFNLAFITTVAIAAYAVLRAWMAPPESQRDTAEPPALPPESRHRLRRVGLLGAFIVLGYLIAAPQLLPSWSLKRASQRMQANEEFDPGYGHIPPWYLCQVATPWIWYARDADPDQALNTIHGGGYAAATNKVEAHLYFGLIPLALAAAWAVRAIGRRGSTDPRLKALAWIGLFAVVYATGWLLPVAEHLPGFGYFRGPGRWGVLTTLAVAILSGSVLSEWTRGRRTWFRLAAAALLIALTACDLSWVAGHQWYTFTVSDPAIAHRHESVVGRMLREQSVPGPARMLAPGPNLASLTGVAITPPYLGFGPDAYYLDGGRLPDVRFLQFLSGETTPSDVDVDAQFEWLRNAGVTHILSMKPLPPAFPVQRIWMGVDPLLNRAWGRREPLYVYLIDAARGRAFLEPAHSGDVVRVTEQLANRLAVEVECGSDSVLVVTDLPWPGWKAWIDGATAAESDVPTTTPDPTSAEPVQRRLAVPAGRHQVVWTYSEPTIWPACIVSVTALAMLFGLARWRLDRNDRNGRNPSADA